MPRDPHRRLRLPAAQLEVDGQRPLSLTAKPPWARGVPLEVEVVLADRSQLDFDDLSPEGHGPMMMPVALTGLVTPLMVSSPSTSMVSPCRGAPRWRRTRRRVLDVEELGRV
jgi:hypothetical protein